MGSRMVKSKKDLVNHIDYALVAKPHTPMYLIHKYWARKPHNVVSEYIKNYTKEGDIVLDPFCGSGPTPTEAIKLGRKGIGIDLNPISTFLTRMTTIPVDIPKIKSPFEEIEDNCKKEINDLYKTKCKKCGNTAITLATIFDREKAEHLEIRYYCGNCKARNAKKPDDEDLKLLKKIEKMEVPYWYPAQRLAYNGNDFKEGTHIPEVDSVDKLFTKRNLISLSILFNQIEKIKESKVQDIFKFAFTSMSHLASRMCPVAKPGGKGHWSKFSATSFWSQHRYYLPIISMESNVWMLFRSAIEAKQGIINGKTDSNNQIKYYKEAKKFSDLKDGANIFLKTHNALELTQIIPKNSVDYVFTDPPYGGAVQYFELSTLWASWLKMDLNYNDEITINQNQNKDFEYYHKMLSAAFKQAYDVLKPGRYMTVTFHSTDINVWTSIIRAVILAGFDLEKIIYQPPARPSAKGLLQPYGSAVGDYYIRFKKPEIEKQNHIEQVDEKRYKRIIIESAKKIIAERGEPTPYTFILNGIIVELKKEGALLSGTQNPDKVMKDFVDKEFVLVDAKDENGKSIGKKWWLKEPSSVPYLEMIPLVDRVESAVVDVLRRKIKVSFDDVQQEIFIKYPNALTPDTHDIKEILKEYATPTKEGNWMLKPQVKVRESEHSRMICYLALLGQKAGFGVWIGEKEQGEMYNKEKLSSFVTNKNPVWRFIPTMNLDRVKQIDVIWHDEGRVKYEFEVENTTAITEAIVRGSNIPHDNIKRLIVIPEEREALLFRKMKEPMLNENIIKNNWKFLFYKNIENFFEKNKKTKKIELDNFEKLFKLPKEARQTQNSLNIYV